MSHSKTSREVSAMLSKDAKLMIKKLKPELDVFDEYDRTHRYPLAKTVRSFSIQNRTHARLRNLAAERNQSMSSLLDDIINNYGGDRRQQ